MILLYLVGPPGAGKSTLMSALTARCSRLSRAHPFAHDHLLRRDSSGLISSDPVAIEIGRRRESFSGTDALGMSVQPKAVEWIGTRPHSLVLGEGARLGTTGFLLAGRRAGYRVVLAHLSAPDAVLSERRAQRGSKQNEQWMRGAATRASNLMSRMAEDAERHWLDSAAPVDDLVKELVRVDPLLEVLR